MWQYTQPVNVVFGAGSIKRLSEAIDNVNGTRGLLVTSPSFLKNGTAQRLIDLSGGRICETYASVAPNPDVTQCDACTDILRRGAMDFVVALGGGSVMDCAKAAAAFCLGDSSLTAADYLAHKASIPARHLPLIAVPTTGGTGSEVTSVSVLSDHAAGIKAPLSAPSLYPHTALVDPGLTLSVPPRLTAITGFDALCHSIEAYWSRHHQPVCDALALHSGRLILDSLATAVEHPDDLAARTALAEASTIAGMAFAIPKTSAPHACSYPLTNLLGVPHGEACALTLTWFMRFNAANGCARIASLAAGLGYGSADALADAIDTLMERTAMRRDLRDLCLTPARIEEIVLASKHPNLRNNPVEITEENLREMYHALSD